LRNRYEGLGDGAKSGALLSLLTKNPDEKKMVFVRFRETMNKLDDLLRANNMSFTRFDGHMTGPEKDSAVEIFRTQANILLCSESGGEGRNLQFCNTLINFDLPWNPQIIEQRIGRIHRIGQKREVFIFNLAARHTIEDRILNILDEKINMFELVVGEVQSIMGEMEEEHDFSHMVFKAWIEETEEAREKAFTEIGEKLIDARKKYEEVKSFDDALFGEEFEVV
jgi:SNF2 family DNA or RNA helicase